MDDVAVAITAIGSVLAVLVGAAGLYLRHAIDRRTTKLTEIAERRLKQEHAEAEDRLRLDTAVRSIDLLTDSKGDLKPAPAIGGTLFALSNLDHHDFALSLLGELWPAKKCTPLAAIYVIERALDDESSSTQILAADVLESNAKGLIHGGDLKLPRQFTESWSPKIDLAARRMLFRGATDAIVARNPEAWPERGSLNYFAGVAYSIFRREKNAHLKRDAGRLLLAILRNVHGDGPFPKILHLGERIDLNEASGEAKKYVERATGRGSLEIRELLEDWQEGWPQKAEDEVTA